MDGPNLKPPPSHDSHTHTHTTHTPPPPIPPSHPHPRIKETKPNDLAEIADAL